MRPADFARQVDGGPGPARMAMASLDSGIANGNHAGTRAPRTCPPELGNGLAASLFNVFYGTAFAPGDCLMIKDDFSLMIPNDSTTESYIL